MLYKYGKQTCDFWGVFILRLVYFSILWGRLLDMRLVIANSYPTRTHGIIVNYYMEESVLLGTKPLVCHLCECTIPAFCFC